MVAPTLPGGMSSRRAGPRGPRRGARRCRPGCVRPPAVRRPTLRVHRPRRRVRAAGGRYLAKASESAAASAMPHRRPGPAPVRAWRSAARGGRPAARSCRCSAAQHQRQRQPAALDLGGRTVWPRGPAGPGSGWRTAVPACRSRRAAVDRRREPRAAPAVRTPLRVVAGHRLEGVVARTRRARARPWCSPWRRERAQTSGGPVGTHGSSTSPGRRRRAPGEPGLAASLFRRRRGTARRGPRRVVQQPSGSLRTCLRPGGVTCEPGALRPSSARRPTAR